MKKSSEKLLIASGFFSAIAGFIGSLTNLVKLFIPVSKEAASVMSDGDIAFSMPAPPVQEDGSFTTIIVWVFLLLSGIAVTAYGVHKSKKKEGGN